MLYRYKTVVVVVALVAIGHCRAASRLERDIESKQTHSKLPRDFSRARRARLLSPAWQSAPSS